MNGVLDNSLVALALLASAGYAAASLGPKSLRRRMSAAMARIMARAPRWLGLQRISARLEAASAKGQGACGGCYSCGSGEKAKAPEVTIPVAKIGRRG